MKPISIALASLLLPVSVHAAEPSVNIQKFVALVHYVGTDCPTLHVDYAKLYEFLEKSSLTEDDVRNGRVYNTTLYENFPAQSKLQGKAELCKLSYGFLEDYKKVLDVAGIVTVK